MLSAIAHGGESRERRADLSQAVSVRMIGDTKLIIVTPSDDGAQLGELKAIKGHHVNFLRHRPNRTSRF